jgi:hypothetical protein
MSIKFSFMSGSLSGGTKDLDKSRITIGRGAGNDVRFDPKVDLDASKNHAEITFEDGKYWLTDLNSTNGTYVNGKRINRTLLKSGDQVEFGKGGPKAGVDIIIPGMAGAEPKTRVAQAIDGRGSGVGNQTVAMMIQDALDKAKSSKRGTVGGTAVFIKEAVNSALKKSTRTFKVVTSMVIVVLLAAVVFLVVEGLGVKEDLKLAEEKSISSDQEVKDIKSQMLTDKDKFYNIVDQYHDSVAFIYSETSIYDAKGNTANVVQGFGTGFFVRDDGYLITSKHVIYPLPKQII